MNGYTLGEESETSATLDIDGVIYVVVGAKLDEYISRVPRYEIIVMEGDTSLSNLIGKACLLSFSQAIHIDGVTPRTFSGIVIEAKRVLNADGTTHLALIAAPKFGVLSLSRYSAIYQKKTTLDVWRQVLQRNKIDDIKITGSKTSQVRETCIQYEENDLDFCERLLAEEGYVYFFSDGKDPDKLVVHNPSNPFPSPGGTVMFEDVQGIADKGVFQARSLEHHQVFRPATTEYATYDPGKAKTSKSGGKSSSSVTSRGKPVVYRYVPLPHGSPSSAVLKRFAAAEQRAEVSMRGTTDYPSLHLGQSIQLASSAASKFPKKLTVVGFTYNWRHGEIPSATFEALPSDTPLHPPYKSKPRIAGVHNAIVTGAKAGEPACDEQGRVKVKFFWDLSDATENTSGYIRVAESYAGNGTGSLFLPRAGHEVLVSFINADPDLPVITGQIYNEKNKAPFVSRNTTKSGIISKLGKKTNQLEFEDKSGAELLGLRAAKDFELDVEENAVRNVKKLDTTTIGETSKLIINKDHLTEVKQKTELSTKERVVKTSGTDELSARVVEISADTKIILKVGSSKVEISNSGVKISAPQVSIDGKSKTSVSSSGPLSLKGLSSKLEATTKCDVKGLQVNVAGQVQVAVKAPLGQVSAQGPLMLKGLPMMIN